MHWEFQWESQLLQAEGHVLDTAIVHQSYQSCHRQPSEAEEQQSPLPSEYME